MGKYKTRQGGEIYTKQLLTHPESKGQYQKYPALSMLPALQGQSAFHRFRLWQRGNSQAPQ